MLLPKLACSVTMGIVSDARYALRNLRLAPGFHILLIAILALGTGTSSALFNIVDAVLLRPLPYRDPGRLVALTAVAADPKFDSNGSLPYSDFEELKAHDPSFGPRTRKLRFRPSPPWNSSLTIGKRHGVLRPG
jgi:hypothetical protein